MKNSSINKKYVKLNRLTSNRDPEFTELVLQYLQSTDDEEKQQILDELCSESVMHVHNIARNFIKDREMVKDAVQFAFLQLIRKLRDRTFRGITKSYLGWMYTVIKNYHLDRIRKKDSHHQDLTEAYRLHSSRRPDEEYAETEILDYKNQALAGKRKQYRREVLTARMLGYSHREIAEQLNKTEQKVRQALSHARSDVEKELNRTGYQRLGRGRKRLKKSKKKSPPNIQ